MSACPGYGCKNTSSLEVDPWLARKQLWRCTMLYCWKKSTLRPHNLEKMSPANITITYSLQHSVVYWCLLYALAQVLDSKSRHQYPTRCAGQVGQSKLLLTSYQIVYYQNSSGLGALKRWANVQHENSSLQHLGSPPHTKANTQGRMSTSSQVYFARHEKHFILFAFVSHVNLGFGRRVLDSFRSRVAGGSLGFWVCRVHF